MATPINAVLCALVGAAFWSVLGFAIARHLLPRVLALGAGPVIGWAVFSAASLPILSLIGFSTLTVIGLAAYTVAGTACMCALGLASTRACATTEAASVAGPFVTLIMGFISGVFIPVSMMPAWTRR